MAIQIATNAHLGQKDKGGNPYILHPLWVMNRLSGLNECYMTVGVLHDVIEDTSVTMEYLISHGLTKMEEDALMLLTHKKGVPYLEYISKIKSNLIAKEVKIADLIHNMQIERVESAINFIKTSGCSDKEYMIKRIKEKQRKYLTAYNMLTDNCTRIYSI